MESLGCKMPLLLTAIVLTGTFSTFGEESELKVTKVFSDNMVLQRDMPDPVWGWADPAEKIIIKFKGQEKSTITGADGKWIVHLDPLSASAQPEKLTVTGKSGRREFTNVLVGDVWLCAGQSNMTVTFKEVPEEAAHLERSGQIRFMTAGNAIIPVPQDDVSPFNNWISCDTNNVIGCCRAGYYFGLKLWKELRIPIGLMNVAVGSSSIEAWLPPESLAAHPNWKDGNLAEMERIQKLYREYKNYSNQQKEELFTEYFKTSYGWWSKNLLKDGKFTPEGYEAIFWHMRVTQSACIYNHAIRPMIPVGIKGVLWYQGETNYRDKQYAEKQKSMIDTWRQLWGEGDFPFYTVQIAPYVGGADLIPGFWIQQYTAVSNTKNSGIVSTVDISSDNQGAHPKNKRDVGLRLALLALKDTYGRKDIVASGPTYKAMKITDGKIIVSFDNTGSGLTTKDGNEPDSFEVAGENGPFYHATAVIIGQKVQVRSPHVAVPVNVRFAWRNLANPNLRNKEGLPAFPFNTAEPFFKQKSMMENHGVK
jgi:sialate O-acetylesterase